MFQEYKKDNFTISTNPALLDVDTIHSFLTKSYWVPGISREAVIKSIRHSLCFGLFDGSDQIGFGRVVTDYTRFAYLMDIFKFSCKRLKFLFQKIYSFVNVVWRVARGRVGGHATSIF